MPLEAVNAPSFPPDQLPVRAEDSPAVRPGSELEELGRHAKETSQAAAGAAAAALALHVHLQSGLGGLRYGALLA